MHLIQALAAGFASASLGYVDIYRRGTTTRATLYADFEGSTGIVNTASLSLDANGAKVVFVGELVDVVVKDSGGAVVARFGPGVSAADVEVISPSFTGTDYTTGGSAASKPVDLLTALGRIVTSFGALDGNVLFGGASTALQTALASIGGMFVNVKSPAYGAAGNGATDDTSAVQAAIDAAQTVSPYGIVFFPKGNYRITSALTVATTSSVVLMGAGQGLSVIQRDSAAGHLFIFATGQTSMVVVRDLGVEDLQNATGSLFRVTAAIHVGIYNCRIGTGTTSRKFFFEGTHASSVFTVRDCLITLGAATTARIADTIGNIFFMNNRASISALATNFMLNMQGSTSIVAFNIFDLSASTGSPEVCGFYPSSETDGVRACIGNYFSNPSSGSPTAMNFNRPSFAEFGNNFGSQFGDTGGGIPVLYGAFSSMGADATMGGAVLGSRQDRKYFIQDNSASITVQSQTSGHLEIKRTTNADQTVNFNNPKGPGRLVFVYWNASGGNIVTVTLTTVKGLPTFGLNAGLAITYTFEAVYINSSWKWVAQASTYTP